MIYSILKIALFVSGIILVSIGSTNLGTIYEEKYGEKLLGKRPWARLFSLYFGSFVTFVAFVDLIYEHWSWVFPSEEVIPVNARFVALYSEWRTLQSRYYLDKPSDRERLVKAVELFTLSDAEKLTSDQKQEVELAQGFVEGWKQRTPAGWDAVLAKHSADALSLLARWERARLPAPVPPPDPSPAPPERQPEHPAVNKPAVAPNASVVRGNDSPPEIKSSGKMTFVRTRYLPIYTFKEDNILTTIGGVHCGDTIEVLYQIGNKAFVIFPTGSGNSGFVNVLTGDLSPKHPTAQDCDKQPPSFVQTSPSTTVSR